RQHPERSERQLARDDLPPTGDGNRTVGSASARCARRRRREGGARCPSPPTESWSARSGRPSTRSSTSRPARRLSWRSGVRAPGSRHGGGGTQPDEVATTVRLSAALIKAAKVYGAQNAVPRGFTGVVELALRELLTEVLRDQQSRRRELS